MTATTVQKTKSQGQKLNQEMMASVIFEFCGSPFLDLITLFDQSVDLYNKSKREGRGVSQFGRPTGIFSEQMLQEISDLFRAGIEYLDKLYLDTSRSNAEKKQISAFIKLQMKPWLYMTKFARRVLERPEGYVGDHYTIDLIYMGSVDNIENMHPLGKVIDNLFLAQPGSQVVRDRREALGEFILDLVNNSDSPVHVTTIGCGKAREIQDVFEKIDPSKLFVNLLDTDIRALAGARDNLNKIKGVRNQVTIREFNAYSKKHWKDFNQSVGKQHLVYSAGLFDYFQYDDCVFILDQIHDCLGKDGKVIVGNYSFRNPSKGFMKYILGWDLVLKDEDTLKSMISSCRSKYQFDKFMYDKTYKIQPFLIISKK